MSKINIQYFLTKEKEWAEFIEKLQKDILSQTVTNVSLKKHSIYSQISLLPLPISAIRSVVDMKDWEIDTYEIQEHNRLLNGEQPSVLSQFRTIEKHFGSQQGKRQLEYIQTLRGIPLK